MGASSSQLPCLVAHLYRVCGTLTRRVGPWVTMEVAGGCGDLRLIRVPIRELACAVGSWKSLGLLICARFQGGPALSESTACSALVRFRGC
jgi:hypothetical protein